ncbi:hypothetical protein [Mycobacteroides abscessus]|uniref:hypothetical protein n=1 Tax=Mycobacteroides abscessus TaxID=36809 RepID=UPI0019D2292E|nr:hypothetical protein [Mycobacteroides abscessus]QSN49667.1 hypothetical protein I3U33_26135 [Mycobacteroides abscessus subsp. abscessus]
MDNAMKVAQRLDDPVLIKGCRRELERVLISGIQVTRTTRETALAAFLGLMFVCIGTVVAAWAASNLGRTLVDQIGNGALIVFGSVGAAFGTSLTLHALFTSGGLRRGVSREDIERDLATSATHASATGTTTRSDHPTGPDDLVPVPDDAQFVRAVVEAPDESAV